MSWLALLLCKEMLQRVRTCLNFNLDWIFQLHSGKDMLQRVGKCLNLLRIQFILNLCVQKSSFLALIWVITLIWNTNFISSLVLFVSIFLLPKLQLSPRSLNCDKIMIFHSHSRLPSPEYRPGYLSFSYYNCAALTPHSRFTDFTFDNGYF